MTTKLGAASDDLDAALDVDINRQEGSVNRSAAARKQILGLKFLMDANIRPHWQMPMI